MGAALPMDLLVDFNQRPVGIDLQEYAKQKMALNQRALQLLDIAKVIGPEGHRATSRKGRVQYNKFVQAVYFIEKDEPSLTTTTTRPSSFCTARVSMWRPMCYGFSRVLVKTGSSSCARRASCESAVKV